MELLPSEEGLFEGSCESSCSVGAADSIFLSGNAVGSLVNVSNGGMVIVGSEVDADVGGSFVVGSLEDILEGPSDLLSEGMCDGT
jgi:hypothetical protein